MANEDSTQSNFSGHSARKGGQWAPRAGGQWSPQRGRVLVGTSFLAIASLVAGTFSPIDNVATANAAAGPEIQLLEAQWDNAADAVSTADTGEAEAAVVLQNADLELSQAADAFSQVELGENPYAGTALEAYFIPQVVSQPSIADVALVAALDEAEDKLAVVEQLIATPNADEAVVDKANAELAQALDAAETEIIAAAEDATPEQLAELEDADDALNGAVAAVTDVVDEDRSWISDLAGWTPNIRYAVDRRGPERRLSGEGIDIAIIDSGVTQVQGLDNGNVINGPDLSADAQDPATANIDLYGHGTHLAGIIAGNDGGTPVNGVPHFTGIAPDARLINVKVADGDGGTSITQIVAGIEWVIANKQSNGMDIRIITLAFGYDWDQEMPDPLAAAVEEAWTQGIVVVISAGNRGNGSNGLDNPAVNPYVIAVAGSDQGDPIIPSDDFVADWSSAGDGYRNPDFAAPGRSIVSLRAPGSHADLAYPESHIGDRFAVASGTSQAAAVAAGTIALLLDRNESLTPDQVKALLMDSARNIARGETLDGDGRLRLNRALFRLRTKGPGAAIQQTHARPFLPPAGFGTYSELPGSGWSDGGWAGGAWNGAAWSGAAWSGAAWNGAAWSGGEWNGAAWSGAAWSGGAWNGAAWAGGAWNGAAWG